MRHGNQGTEKLSLLLKRNLLDFTTWRRSLGIPTKLSTSMWPSAPDTNLATLLCKVDMWSYCSWMQYASQRTRTYNTRALTTDQGWSEGGLTRARPPKAVKVPHQVPHLWADNTPRQTHPEWWAPEVFTDRLKFILCSVYSLLHCVCCFRSPAFISYWRRNAWRTPPRPWEMLAHARFLLCEHRLPQRAFPRTRTPPPTRHEEDPHQPTRPTTSSVMQGTRPFRHSATACS